MQARVWTQIVSVTMVIGMLAACSPNVPRVKPTETPTEAAAMTQGVALAPEERFAPIDPFEMQKRLGRGINVANALEAPREGDWGIVIEDYFFPLIRQAGFDTVRIPIRWSAHALREAPYTIDPAFFERVDWVIEQALNSDLNVVINVHHYEELFENPNAEWDRFLALWDQIATRYKDLPPTV
ncbi:MAG: cellulase family glycosylhydrolase, partial [Thermoflexales bacterium]|nr:cellulase family glycosylhydrolase [Thermoflexales bacterium]